MSDLPRELHAIRRRLHALHADLYRVIYAHITHNAPLEGASILSALEDLRALGARIDAVTAILPQDIAAAVAAQKAADQAEIDAANAALATAQADAIAKETELESVVADLTTKVVALETAAGIPGTPTPTPTPTPLTVTTTSLPDATVGAAYSAQITTDGGVPPITISVSGLPDGLTADSSGAISGTPTTAGVAVVSVSATDSAAAPATATLSLNIG